MINYKILIGKNMPHAWHILTLDKKIEARIMWKQQIDNSTWSQLGIQEINNYTTEREEKLKW